MSSGADSDALDVRTIRHASRIAHEPVDGVTPAPALTIYQGSTTGAAPGTRVVVADGTAAAVDIRHVECTCCALAARCGTDQYDRLAATVGGQISWGSGAAAADVQIARSGISALTLTGSLTVTGALAAAGVGAVTCAYKTADETVTNSAALQDDDALALAVAASSTYVLDGLVIYSAATAADAQFAVTGPSGASCAWSAHGLSSSAASTSGSILSAASTIGDAGALTVGGVAAGTKVTAHVRGLVTVAATAGTLTLRWAQASADASDIVVYAGSYLVLRRVA